MDLTEIDKAVADGDGYAAISVKTLRDAVGYARAKVHVVSEISAALQAAGYGHMPLAIPRQQNRVVLVYKQGAGVGASVLSLIELLHGDGEKADGAAWLLTGLLPKLKA